MGPETAYHRSVDFIRHLLAAIGFDALANLVEILVAKHGAFPCSVVDGFECESESFTVEALVENFGHAISKRVEGIADDFPDFDFRAVHG